MTGDGGWPLVLDASAAMDLVLGQPWSLPLRARMRDAGRLNVPVTWHIECLAVVRSLTLGGLMTEHEAQEARSRLSGLRLMRWATEPLGNRIWSLRHNMTAYDASYVALAEQLGATLATGDRRLAKATRMATAVDVLELTA